MSRETAYETQASLCFSNSVLSGLPAARHVHEDTPSYSFQIDNYMSSNTKSTRKPSQLLNGITTKSSRPNRTVVSKFPENNKVANGLLDTNFGQKTREEYYTPRPGTLNLNNPEDSFAAYLGDLSKYKKTFSKEGTVSTARNQKEMRNLQISIPKKLERKRVAMINDVVAKQPYREDLIDFTETSLSPSPLKRKSLFLPNS